MGRVMRRVVLALVVMQAALVAILTLAKRRLPSRGDEDSDEIALTVIMEAKELVSRSRRFRGGAVVTAAGACQLDLRSAILDPQGARLEVRTIMGATSVTVPTGWSVDVVGRSVGGAIADNTKAGLDRAGEPVSSGDGPTPDREAPGSAGEDTGASLRLDVLAVLGAVEIGHESVTSTGSGSAPVRTGEAPL